MVIGSFWSWYGAASPQVQGAVIGAIASIVFGTLIAWVTHWRNTKPILIFIRRPDWNWRIKNIGRGPAFRVLFRDKQLSGKHEDTILYPIAEGEEVSLGTLKYGDILVAYYADWHGMRTYKTYCQDWRNRVWYLPYWPRLSKAKDETRLKRPELLPLEARLGQEPTSQL
jgi:hypothetical protein